MPKITKQAIEVLSNIYGLSYAQVMMIVGVESSGSGFSKVTGKMLIQFEPRWFKIKYSMWKKHKDTWIANKVGDQQQEWLAFGNAYAIDPIAAMQSTSMGMMQVMGFHYKLLGFKTVGEMWNFASKSEANQLELGLKFIHAFPIILKAVRELDYKSIALHYNGEAYHLYNYDTRLEIEYNKYV